MLHRELVPTGPQGWRGGLLCDDVGLGKSMQMLGTMARNPMPRNIIVTFKNIVEQWDGYAQRWLPSHTLVHLGSNTNQALRMIAASNKAGRPAVLLTTYGLLSRRCDSLRALLWDRVVLDECHAIKNRRAKRFDSAMLLPARIRWGLSASPLQNTLEDIHSLMRWLRASSEPDSDKPAGVAEKIRMAQFRRTAVLSRTRQDVVDQLPWNLQEAELVTLSRPFDNDAEAEGYEAMRQLMGEGYRKIVSNSYVRRYGNVASKRMAVQLLVLRLMEYTASPQLACIPAMCLQDAAIKRASHIRRSTKTRLLMDALRQTREHRSVVFCKFVGEMYEVVRATKEIGMSVEMLCGDTPAKARSRILSSAWMTYGVVARVCALPPGLPPEIVYKIFGLTCPQVLVAQIDCTGVGINLTGFTRCYFHTLCWNPCQEMQAIGRLNRIGQRHKVVAARLATEGVPRDDWDVSMIDEQAGAEAGNEDGEEEEGEEGEEGEEEGHGERRGAKRKVDYDYGSWTIDTRILKRQAMKRELIGWWGGPCPVEGRRRMNFTFDDMKELLR